MILIHIYKTALAFMLNVYPSLLCNVIAEWREFKPILMTKMNSLTPILSSFARVGPTFRTKIKKKSMFNQ